MLGGSGIHTTSNGGQNWNLSSSMISTSGITGEGNKWWSIQSYSPSIFYSSNNGVNWSTQFYDTSIQFTHIAIPRNHPNQYSVWAEGNPGKIFKLNSMVGIEQVSNEIPEGYFLSQNYPNPFNPTTKITFQIAQSGIVKLIVNDILGKHVLTILNEFKIAGSYEIEFDGSSLSSGIYFYKIATLNYIDSKKMIVIK